MHRTTPQFWDRFDKLPANIQHTARKNFDLLKQNPRHPSLRFKKVGAFWSARVGRNYRVLAIEDGSDYIWVWIGSHEEYERLNRLNWFNILKMKDNSFDRVASQIDRTIRALDAPNTAAIRGVRRQFSQELKPAEPEFVLDVARTLIRQHNRRWLAYELIRFHRATFQRMGAAELEELGQGMNSWDTVDAFARILSGPAWLKGQISDELIHQWAHAADLWWRRAALVSTVALNMRSQGGTGDVPRTLAVCEFLVADHEDMIVKAMSWALRELVPHDPQALEEFVETHDAQLAARVKREIKNKLTTGLKTPR